jgi:peptide deformylase
MNKDAIITLPNPHLRQKSARVHVITDEIKQVIADMTSACLDWEASRPHEVAAALAAVQIDRMERIVIVRADFEDKDNKEFFALINPEIIKHEGTPVVIQPEGCLSIKEIYGEVLRYPKIRVKATTVDGQEVRIKAEGFLSMLLQHEIDHTKGIVFIDHIRDNPTAFYRLDKKGELHSLDYTTHVKDNDELWQ